MRPFVLLSVLFLAACNFGGRSELHGDFRFEQVDEMSVPTEFPPGSGDILEDGSLSIDESGRFSLRFFALGAQEVEPIWNVLDGAYTVDGDSLFFTPDDARGTPPLRFRYEASPDELRLWDADGYEWIYSRRAD